MVPYAGYIYIYCMAPSATWDFNFFAYMFGLRRSVFFFLVFPLSHSLSSICTKQTNEIIRLGTAKCNLCTMFAQRRCVIHTAGDPAGLSRGNLQMYVVFCYVFAHF